MRDAGPTEVGGFAVSSHEDLLLIEDIFTIQQKTSVVTVKFDDKGIADFTEDMAEDGLHPQQFLRIWWHTHPGISAQPSSVDENTFEKIFGQCNWSIMFILAKGGEYYARLQLRDTLAGSVLLPVKIEHTPIYNPSWQEEYNKNIMPIKEKTHGTVFQAAGLSSDEEDLDLLDERYWRWSDWETDCVTTDRYGDEEFNLD